MDENNVILLQAILGESDGDPNASAAGRESLNAADVIIAHDVKSDHTAVVYGPELLYGFDGGGDAEPVNILRVGIDFENNELDRLLELVESVKGSHDYEYES